MKIYRSQVPWKDSFQELLEIWKELKFCEVLNSKDKFSWIESEKKILLHEHDRVETLPYFDFGLFANEMYYSEKSKPWIYWPRHPRKVSFFLKQQKNKNFSERKINSIFIGSAENHIQLQNRTRYQWNKAVERFEFFTKNPSEPYRYTNEEYLNIISGSRFGLSLEGYGNKCQRDIEYMALGTVPIFTWKKFNDYDETLIENVHYLYAETPEECKEKINDCSEKKWNEMSFECQQWYERNCSAKGSFNKTIEILNKNKIST